MKKTKIVSLVLFIGIIFLLSGCASTPDDLYVSPDPENPFQGTWLYTGGSTFMHIIQGTNGAFYIKAGYSGWRKNAVYTIEQNGDTYVTSNNWRIRVDGNILTVENMTYERVVK